MGEAEQIRRVVRGEMDRRLIAIAEHALGASQRIVLLDEGTLAASGHLEPEHGVRHDPGGRASIDIVYSTPYAARRHEEVDVTPSVPGRHPKWLERTIKENLGRYERILSAPLGGFG